MFHVCTPALGDLVLYLGPKDTYSGFQFGLYIPRGLSRIKSYGLRPNTKGRDQFNNSNCDHLNIKGSVFSMPEFSNVVRKDGPKFYAKPDFASQAVIYKGWQTPTVFCSRIIARGTSSDQSITVYHYYRWWQERTYRMVVTAISDFKYRIEYFYRYRRVDTNIWLGPVHNVTYVEYDGSFTKFRSKSYTGLPYDQRAISWEPFTTDFTPILNKTVISGNQKTWIPDTSDIVRRTKYFREWSGRNDSSSFGKCSIDAVQSLKVFDGQLLLYLRDFVSLKGTVLSFWESIAQPSLRTLSSAYLSYHYGLKLTYRDTLDLLTSTRRLRDGVKGYNSSRSRLSVPDSVEVFGKVIEINHIYNMKLYVKDYPNHVVQAIKQMMVADFFPTFELVWDLIPFSFVVDWFVRVGDILEAVDSNTLLSVFQVLSCVYSRSTVMRLRFEDLYPELQGVVEGDLEIVDYHRYVNPVPPPFALDYSTPQSFNHWLEGSALIAQRIRV